MAKEKLTQIKKSAAEAKQSMRCDRKEANLLVMAADMLRCSVAAHATGAEVGAEDRLQMGQGAAILTQLGVHKLQKGAQAHTKAFCGAFGIAQTADIEQLVTDPAMMDSTQQAEVQRRFMSVQSICRVNYA